MSPLAFRNVDASPDDPVSEWPLEAIQTALGAWRSQALAATGERGLVRPLGAGRSTLGGSALIQPPLRRRRGDGASDLTGARGCRGIGARDGSRRGQPSRAGIGPLPSRVRIPHRHLGLPPLHLRHGQGHPVSSAAGTNAPHRARLRKERAGRMLGPFTMRKSIEAQPMSTARSPRSRSCLASCRNPQADLGQSREPGSRPAPLRIAVVSRAGSDAAAEDAVAPA